MNFDSITATITECWEGGDFRWNAEAQRSFELLKNKLTNAHIFSLPDFGKLFEIQCDASNVGIGGVLSQERKPIAFLVRN